VDISGEDLVKDVLVCDVSVLVVFFGTDWNPSSSLWSHSSNLTSTLLIYETKSI
jgi:hypothetical protein